MIEKLVFNWRELNKIEKICYSIFFLFFAIYILTLKFRPYPFAYLVKIVPIISLAIVAIVNIQGTKGKLIFIGLIFSAVGDVFLAISGKVFFVYGLSAFALAHTMYISAFIRNPSIRRSRFLLILIFILYGISILYILLPNLGKMTLPVIAYIIVISLMGISSALGKKNHYLVIIGAILFIVSDSIIAVNMFLSKVWNSSFWIMITYYPAQFLITYGSSKIKD
jgi:uncharacterized membrane protein YhhN